MKLKKGLGFYDVFSIATGAMISSGIFILPGLAFARSGPAVFISYLLAGILALIGIFSIIELSTAIPKAGGDYYYINRSLGPLIGTISGFLSWFALSLKSAFAIFGIAEIIYLISGFPVALSALAATVFFTFLNIVGVKEAAKFQVVLVSGLLLLMLLYIVIGFGHVDITRFSPFMTEGFNAVLATAGFIFISFGGLLNVASISEEVRSPQKNIPLGMIFSVLLVTIIYTLILIITTGILPADVFSGSLTPIADAARNIAGTTGFVIISIAASLAFVTTANAGIMSASRYPLALSRDNLLPQQVGRINSKLKTPVISVLLTGLFIIISLQLPLGTLVKVASVVILTAYVLTNLAVIILRESRIRNYQPSFKTPLYPWLQIAGIIIFIFFIIDLGVDAVEISIGFLLLSFLIYFFYGRKKFSGEYALLHLLKRITDNRLTEHLLESEFREIIYDRDNIEPDKFDHLVKDAVIIDVDKNIDVQELFELIAGHLSKKTSLTETEIIRQLLERQKEFNCAITSFVAIPHLLIEDMQEFDLLVIRSRNGINFSEKENAVKAVFAFAGSSEDRPFHLKTLASIAQIAQQEDFEQKWLQADTKNHLKDIILLSSRKRT